MRISTRSISLFRDLVTVGRAGRGQGTSPRSSLSAGCRFRTVHCRAWSASFTTSARKEELVLPRYRLRARPLSESIFASLGAYFRAYLHALDNAGADGAPACRDPRLGPARITYVKGPRDLLAFLPSGCHRVRFCSGRPRFREGMPR